MKSQTLSGYQQLNETLSNLRQGDAVVLNIDSLLFRHEADEYGEEALSLSDKRLPDLLRHLQETGHPIILLTAYEDKNNNQTVEQFAKLGLKNDAYTLLRSAKQTGEMLIEHIENNAEKFKDIKRLHVVNGKLEQLESIEDALSKDTVISKKISRLHYYYQHNTQLLIDTDRSNTFPEALESISNPVSLGDSTTTFKVEENKQEIDYVLKFGDNQAQIKIEILMNVLYERLGVPVPKVQAYQAMPQALAKLLGQDQVAQTIQLSEYFDPAETQDEQAIIKQACHDFVIHALMGNIDIANSDNFIQTKSGEVKLVNSGVNFLYGPQGQSREAAHIVNEMRDMRSWFNTLTDEDIKNQVKLLMGKHDLIEQTIWEVSQQLELPASLQQQLIAGFSHRLDDLAQHYGFATQPFAKRDKAAIQGKTAAGVMHLQRNEHGELCVLLSKRNDNPGCDNFGGKSDKGDNTLAFTAQREVNEESNGALLYSDRELAEASFHDVITIDKHGKQFLYRMYFVLATQALDVQKIHDYEHTSHHWVPLKSLLTALHQDQQIIENHQTTIQVKDKDGNTIMVFPPLYQMLKQQPVLTLIDKYVKDKLVVTRTQGLASNAAIEYAKQEYENDNPYRPIASTSQVKTDIVTTQLNKAKILDDIKHQRHQLYEKKSSEIQQESNQGEQQEIPQLSQSEFHLKTIMGKDFKNEAPIATNVRKFLETYSKETYSEQDRDKLIKQAVAMIEYEKSHPETVFFYHGVSSQISYSYAIYTALYQIIAADTTFDTLRTDNALFHKCLDMQSFITHFQHLTGDGILSDWHTGYRECVLSTNFFLFGNHDKSGENTIRFYTSNLTAAPINLKNMLEASFKSMGIPDSLISQLSELANEFPQNGYGAIYQIGLPKTEVDNYAYLAGVQGVLNPLVTAEGTSSNVSTLFTAVRNNEDIESDYVKNVQARVMAPPDAPITTNVFNWGQQTSPIQQATFDMRLNKLVKDMSYNILQHQFNMLNSKSALMRYLPNIMQQAGIIRDEGVISDELIIRYIEAGDFESIKTIVESHPEYKEKHLVYTKKAYAPSSMSHDESQPKTLLERCLAERYSGEAVRSIFGNNFYEGKLDSLPFHQVVGALPINERMEFTINHPDKINDGNSLSLVLRSIPEDKKNDIVNIFHHKINNCRELINVLRMLPDDAKLNLVEQHKNKIQNGIELSNVIKELPEDAKLDFANKNVDKIDGLNLARVIHELPKNAQLDFANRNAAKINDGGQLSIVIHELAENARLTFVNRNIATISNGDELASVIRELAEDDKLDFAKKHADKINGRMDLVLVVDGLPVDTRFDFAKDNIDKVTHGKDFVQLLFLLRNDVRLLGFSYEHANIIKNGDDLYEILNLLTENARFDFANRNADKIQDGMELSAVIKALPKDAQLDFANRNANKIQDGLQLKDVIDVLPNDQKFAFSIMNLNKIKNNTEFKNIKRSLDEKDRDKFSDAYNSYQNLSTHYKMKAGSVEQTENRSKLSTLNVFTNKDKKLRKAEEINKTFDDFTIKISNADSLDNLNAIINDFKRTQEYKTLKANQGHAGRLLGLKSDSITTLNKIIKDKRIELMSQGQTVKPIKK